MMTVLIDKLIRDGYLKKDKIIEAFNKIKREDFVPEDIKSESQADIPLPIGFGQTISQPLTVAFMLERLDPDSDEIILDIGSGSGWTTALLAYIVGEKGKVIAIERVPELYEFGRKNIEKYSFIKKGIVEIYCADGTRGFPRHAPYDKILVSAATDEVPTELKRQLAIKGKMIIPVNNSIWQLDKKDENEFAIKKFSGFSFVPLIKKNPF